MQSNHMDRMHMWSSFNILIEDLWLSSNVAVTVTKNRKLLSTKYFKIRYKASCHQTWWKWCIYDPLPDLWLLTLVVYEKWLLSLQKIYFFLIRAPEGNYPLLLKMMGICIFPLHSCTLYFRKDRLHVHF